VVGDGLGIVIPFLMKPSLSKVSFFVFVAILLQSCGPQFKAPPLGSLSSSEDTIANVTTTTMVTGPSTTTSTTTTVPGNGNPHEPDPNVKLVLSASAPSQNQLSLKVHDSRTLEIKSEHLIEQTFRIDNLQNLAFEVAGEIDGDRWIDFAVLRADYTSSPEKSFARLVSSKTSEILFERQGSSTVGQIRHMTMAPDLNGDGFKEVLLIEDNRIKIYAHQNSQVAILNLTPGCSLADFYMANLSFVDVNNDGLKDLFYICSQYDSAAATINYRARALDLKILTPDNQRVLFDTPFFQAAGSAPIFDISGSESSAYIATRQAIQEGNENLYRQLKVFKFDRFVVVPGSAIHTAQVSTIYDDLTESHVNIDHLIFDNVDSTDSPEMFMKISRTNPFMQELKFVSLEPETVWTLSLQNLRNLVPNFNPYFIWNWTDRPITTPDNNGDQKKELLYTIGGADNQGNPVVQLIKHSGISTDVTSLPANQNFKFYLGIQ
jgi:hypothetical protein